jgi:type IV fimbrial biogenesis protein FimT
MFNDIFHPSLLGSPTKGFVMPASILPVVKYVQMSNLRAFTLLELLMTLNILVLLLMMAFPAMQEWIARQQAESYVRQLRQQLNFARLTAVSSGQTVQFCPLAGAQCLDQWWQWPIQIRLQRQALPEPETLRILPQPAVSHWLYYNRNQLQFRADGSLNALQNGTFVYCAKNYRWHYTLTLSQAGRSQLSFVPQPCPR